MPTVCPALSETRPSPLLRPRRGRQGWLAVSPAPLGPVSAAGAPWGLCRAQVVERGREGGGQGPTALTMQARPLEAGILSSHGLSELHIPVHAAFMSLKA